MSASPNPLAVAWSVVRAQSKRYPNPTGTNQFDHSEFAPILTDLANEGVRSLQCNRAAIAGYRSSLESIDPDNLTRSGALAYWINIYNAGTLELVARSADAQHQSVLQIAGGFREQWVRVAGETLSLDAIEHGKIRRFGDPRVHAALVCGSASCPTLRNQPFDGQSLDDQLEDQVRYFLAHGGVVADPTRNLLDLSRVLLWYSGDFTRPQNMPTWLPGRRRQLVDALAKWLPCEINEWRLDSRPTIGFAAYNWNLGCAVR